MNLIPSTLLAFLFITILFGCMALADRPMPDPACPWGNAQPFNEGWFYLESQTVAADSRWTAVSLPHSWNTRDTIAGNTYRRGISWYRHPLKLSADDLKQRLFLRFGAAGQEAEVFVNGQSVGKHSHGYSAFTFEITRQLKAGENRIDVWVSNAENKNMVPSGDGLFNLYGGLYRGVQLIRAPRVCLARNVRGGPGIRVWSKSVSDKAADLHVQATIDSDGPDVAGYRITAELADPSSKIVSTATGVSGQFQLPAVSNPLLWSPEKPSLYTLTVKLVKDGKEVDRAVVRHGFRFFQFTADKGFFLNGRPYKLHGVNRHQDLKGFANAVPLEHHYRDIRLIKELGANWLRLAHYQQDDYVLQLCDELGILVWEEIPWVQGFPDSEQFKHNAKTALTEMIAQHFNHPAVIVWGMGNEIAFKKGKDGRAEALPLVKDLNNLIHREDPIRKSVIVSGDGNTYSHLKIMTVPDLIGYNLYKGWYGGKVSELTARINDLHHRDPSKPMIISEFGAGFDPALHSEKPKCFDQTQEYQTFFMDSYLRQMDAIPWLCGYNWWNFGDFGWGKSKTPPLYNNKGMVTYDRKQKKDAFFLFKSRFSAEPVLHLCSPTWTTRGGNAQKTYRVFTNLQQVEFFLDGKSLGKQSAGFIWTVTLHPGENHLKVIGQRGNVKLEDGFTVNYQQKATSTPAGPTADPNENNPFKE